jgi:thiamine monophosphate kinase
VTTLAELGEFGLLAELERRGLAEGIEHDAAVVDGVVVTQDALVEGVHFRFGLLGWRELGARASAVNLSDLAASGAEPLALLVSLAVPAETELEDVLDLSDGLARDAAHIAERSGVRLAIELERVPLSPGAELDDAGFGEDYELLATTPEALGFQVIGRVEQGEGVALTLGGERYELAGWEHFR